MGVCPKCKYEYRPEIGICPDCNEKLVENLPEEKLEEVELEENSKSGDGQVSSNEEVEWVLLCTTDNIFYFQVLEQALKENGIVCLFQQQTTRGSLGFGAWHSGAGGPIMVYVPKDRLEEAKSIREQTVNNP